MSATAQRADSHIDWVDPCKGIGIAAIVLGHALPNTAISSFLFLFHVPIFFFLSGFLHRPQQKLADYLKKKTIHLLVPYLAFLVVLAPAVLLHYVRHGESIRSLVVSCVWGGSEMQGPYAVFWFVTCLFFTQQIMNLLLSRFGIRAATIIVCGFMIVGYANALTVHLLLPLDANVALEASPFFLAGYLFRKFTIPKWAGAVGLVLAVAAIVLIHFGVPISYDMKYAHYGVPVLSFVLALGCILATIAICRTLLRFPAVSRPIASLGVASMGIMYLHEFFLVQLSRFHNGPLAFVFALGFSFAITRALAKGQFTSAVFLGNVPRPAPSVVAA